MGGKSAESQRIDNFRVDAKRLLKTYSRIEMAKRLGFNDSSYLGRCIKGPNKPGEPFLDKFYSVFGPELKPSKPESGTDLTASGTDLTAAGTDLTASGTDLTPGNPNTGDRDAPDLHLEGKKPQAGSTFQEDLIDLLRQHNRDLMSCVNEFGSALKNFGVTAVSFQTLADSNAKLVEMQKDYISMLKEGRPLPPVAGNEPPGKDALAEKR